MNKKTNQEQNTESAMLTSKENHAIMNQEETVIIGDSLYSFHDVEEETGGTVMMSETCSECEMHSNTIDTAVELTLNQSKASCFCCPEDVHWYKFTPSVTRRYTVHTLPGRNTVGYLYDSCENLIGYNDDHNLRTYFKIEAELNAGQTYYIMVQTAENDMGSYMIRVEDTIWAMYLSLTQTSATMEVGETLRIPHSIYPLETTERRVLWTSSNDAVATVADDGTITALSPGTATIRIHDWNNRTTGDKCVVTVPKGKTPVFLIHGRTSNSADIWGAETRIGPAQNDHYDSSLDAVCNKNEDGISYSYIQHTSHDIQVVTPSEKDKKYLTYELIQNGYVANVNLFAFNYPNYDAVVYNARKFKMYIDSVITYVRTQGSETMKWCFYASQADYDANNYKFNIVAHSMGGLVARYYIENMGQDSHVEKLITICTPHWGSGVADVSNNIGVGAHKLCDHDLDRDSAMYGGSSSMSLSCNIPLAGCPNSSYCLTEELQYNKNRSTKYYAIAGVDYNAYSMSYNDYCIEVSPVHTTYSELLNEMQLKTDNQLYMQDLTMGAGSYLVPMDVKTVGDNMVGFLSQIGWTENDGNLPNKKIQFEKIYVDIDTDGGNCIFDRLHSKILYRQYITDRVNYYLME